MLLKTPSSPGTIKIYNHGTNLSQNKNKNLFIVQGKKILIPDGFEFCNGEDFIYLMDKTNCELLLRIYHFASLTRR